jgi:hypothetical protein
MENENQTLTKELMKIIPKQELQRVLNQNECDIDGEFLGFVEYYYHLSRVIPKHWTVIDLGCAYNPQCYYFSDHKKYVAVDLYANEIFKTNNCDIYKMSIQDFISEHLGTYNTKETFAICTFVPPWHGDNSKIVRDAFENIFVYYPSGIECETPKKIIE